MVKTILVADDHREDVEDLIKQLRVMYTVEYAPNGWTATERIKQGGLDGAILDWDMACGGGSQYDGDAVVKTARELHPDLVLVLRSSRAHVFEEELEPFRVYCHSKQYGDEKILTYLEQKLGGVGEKL